MPSEQHARFHDGVTAQPHDVVVEAAEDALVVRDVAGTVRALWPWTRIRRLGGGTGLRLALGHASPRLTILDPQLAATVAARLPSAWPLRRRWALATTGAVLTAVAVAYLTVVVLPGVAIRHVPDAWTRALGEMVLRSLAADASVCEGPGRDALDGLTARLLDAARAQRADVQQAKLVVLDMALPNAFALPGGILVVTRGLIARAPAAEAVAGILAHEVGHAIEHHPDEGVVRALGVRGLLALIGAGSGAEVLGYGAMLALLRHSRDQEREADEWAVRLLAAIGAPGTPTAMLLERLEPDQDDMPTILSTHPGAAERAEHLRAVTGEAPVMTSKAWDEVRRVCGAAIPSPRP